MKILLSDASGLSSRQIATILSRRGHTIHVLSPDGLTLTRFTSHVSRIHPVPPFGIDPYMWLDTTLAIITNEKRKGKGFDVLICTQEQVAILSAEMERVEETGVKVAVPEFGSLRRVMDKVSACEALRKVGLGQPESVVLSSLADVDEEECEGFFPGFAKLPIATGSTGVRRVVSSKQLRDVCQSWHAFEEGGKVLLQKEVKAPLLMICGIFSHGKLVAWHCCLRAREGVNGGAIVKVSCPMDTVGQELGLLGRELKWHGGLSMDAILLDKGGGDKTLFYIDINPRIVEPMNGLLAGVDLVGGLLDVSFRKEGETGGEKPKHGNEGVTTHQFVLALLASAKEGRVAMVREVWMAFRGLEGFYGYKGSVEELTPIEEDWWSVLVLVVMTVLLLLGGKWSVEKITGGNIKNYAISPEGWDEVSRREDEKQAKTGEAT